jgi:hypothetical protein
MLQSEVLVCKFFPIDALATSTVTTSKITTLAHEIRNYTVEFAAFETKSLIPSAQCTEILYKKGKYDLVLLYIKFCN